MASRMRIGYIGLGNIGLPMAANLIEYIQLHQESRLVVWNRTKDKYELLPNACGVEDLDAFFGTQCNVIFTSFANDSVAEEVYATLFTKAQNDRTGDKIFVDQSTLNPKTSASLEAAAKRIGVTYLAAPVFGQPPAVVAKTMLCTVAGDPKAVAFVLPILECLGRAVIQMGPDVQQGAKAKLLVNMMLYESIQVFSEVYTLAEATGFPVDKLHQVFRWFSFGGPWEILVRKWLISSELVIPAPPLLNYSNRISKGDFDGSTGFRLDGGIKDVKHMLSLREDLEHEVPLPTLERVLANLEKAKVLSGDKAGEMSVEALSAVARDQAGLKPFKS